jgi:hypothetical protein
VPCLQPPTPRFVHEKHVSDLRLHSWCPALSWREPGTGTGRLNPGAPRVGPHVSGLVGRSAGSVEGARYSKALSASGFVWDEERLQDYLNNPRQAVPGTTMSVSIRDAAQRSAIISYLRSIPGETTQ